MVANHIQDKHIFFHDFDKNVETGNNDLEYIAFMAYEGNA